MAILARCPACNRRQSIKNKKCKCGEDLDKAKRSKRVAYFVIYRLPDGKQKWQSVDAIEDLDGYSIDDARAAEAKRKVQKKENRVMDMLPESKLTFEDLSDWYLDLSSVKKLASYDRVCQCFKMFNSVFGDWLLNDIKQTDLEEYQLKRLKKGRANATVDMEIKIVQTAVTKAFDNDKIDGHCLKAFRKTKRLLETGANARKILITIEQYLKLLEAASNHYKAVLIIALNTGMRLGEIKALQWSHIDRAAMMIRLPAGVTKENRTKDIPINHHVQSVLDSLPVPINRDHVIKYMEVPLNGKSSLKKQFPETCEKAGIPHGRKTLGGISFHDIRRTVKTNMLKAGIDKPHRDTIFGHSLKGMDAHYIVPTDESLTEAMQKYTVWLDKQIEVVSAIVSQNVSQNKS